MAIGTAAAIGLGVAGVGRSLGASSANKASKRAAGVAQDTANQNNALARDIYGQNSAVLAPYVNAGVPAASNINALLGMGGVSPTPAAQAGAPDWNQYLQANPDVMQGYYTTADRSQFGTPQEYAQWHYGRYGVNEGRAFPTTPQAAATATVQPAGTAQQSAEQAFDTFRNSTGYQFRLGEGINALNSGYAGAGTLQSGAAMKGITEYGQNFASNEFGNYLNALQQQQAVGAGAASAQAGVAQNFGNMVTQNNNAAGSAAANAALMKQNALANSLSLVGGGMFGFGSR